MNDQNRQEALEDAVRNAVASHVKGTKVPHAVAAPKSSTWRVAVILVGWAVIGWIWIAEPQMVFGPRSVAELPVAEREARLRYAMYLHHAEIGAFTRDSGRVPTSLAELDMDAADGVRMAFDDQGMWSLEGTDGEISLQLTEKMSADSFLGTSVATLEEAR